MRKFIVVISILALLFCLISAAAEEIDLESMTTDELVELQIKVQDELYKRDRFMNCFLNPGEYVVGEDFEAGDYSIHCVEAFRTSGCKIDAIDSETKEQVIHYMSIKPDGLYRAKLKNGVILRMLDGVIELLPNN